MSYKIAELIKKWHPDHSTHRIDREKPDIKCALCGIGLGISHYEKGDFKHEYEAETLVVKGKEFIVDKDCRNYLIKYDDDKQYDLLTNKTVCG